jgi:hypothetical protein
VATVQKATVEVIGPLACRASAARKGEEAGRTRTGPLDLISLKQ